MKRRNLFILAVLALITISNPTNVAAIAQPVNLRVASFNVLFYRPEGSNENNHSPTTWGAPDNRRELIVKTIVDNDWDLAGLQEVNTELDLADGTKSLSMIKEIRQDIQSKGYEMINADFDGCNFSWREGGRKIYTNPIIYKTSMFNVVDRGCYSLSSDPDNLSKMTVDGKSRPKVASWAKLRNQKTGLEIYLFNTHITFRGQVYGSDGQEGTANDAEYRAAQADQVKYLLEGVKRIAGGSKHVFLTGDYNADEGSLPVDKIIEAGYVSSRNLAKSVNNDNNTKNTHIIILI